MPVETEKVELSEEEQVEAMINEKSGEPRMSPGEEKPEKKEEEEEEDDSGKEKPAKEEEEKSLTKEEISEKLDEIKGKKEDDLTDEDKDFLKEHAEKPEKKKDDEDETVTADKYIEDQYGEKFGIKSQKDLDEFIETAAEITSERDKLKTEVTSLKENGPVYKSPGQKVIAEFLEKTGYEPGKFPEGMQTHAQLMATDLEDKDLDPKLTLELQFILDHPELTREEARYKFEKVYTKKYVHNKDNFDSEEEYQTALKDAKIDQKSDLAKALKALKKSQQEFKVVEPEKEEKKVPEVAPEIKNSIEKNVKSLNELMAGAEELIFSPTDNEEDDFPFVLTKEQKKGIVGLTTDLLSSPIAYDDKGNLTYAKDPEQLARRVADYLYGDQIREKLHQHLTTIIEAKRIEELGEKQPNRKPKGGAAANVDMSEEKQQEILLKKKQKQSA